MSERAGDVTSFEITTVAPLGTKRSRLKGTFIPSVIGATEAFYSAVLQPVGGWVAPAPRLASVGVGEGGGEVELATPEVFRAIGCYVTEGAASNGSQSVIRTRSSG